MNAMNCIHSYTVFKVLKKHVIDVLILAPQVGVEPTTLKFEV